jgi:hypothetical protein
MFWFINGLDERLANLVIAQNPDNLLTCMTLALQHEYGVEDVMSIPISQFPPLTIARS